jgi:beta-phosphoglucomutase-like phosphatase (HAD superfamily)
MRPLRTADALRAFFREQGPFGVAVWDFDGVIVDSEHWQEETYRILLKRRGCRPAAGFFVSLAGRTEPEIWSLLASEFEIHDGLDTLRAERIVELQRLFAAGDAPNWFVGHALDELDRARTGSRIVSSAYTEILSAYLERWDLAGRFDSISTGGSCDGPPATSKRARLAMALDAGANPLLIEDSPSYLAFGRACGARVVAVRHTLNAANELDGDAVIDSEIA